MKTICNIYKVLPGTFLGIGDIIIPALFLNYSMAFDVSRSKFPIYFILNFCGIDIFLAFSKVLKINFIKITVKDLY